MTSFAPLTLFTRDGCHLCERVAQMLDAAGFEWHPLDVDEDPDLAARYGLSVPVLQREDTGGELAYPFDEVALEQFLR